MPIGRDGDQLVPGAAPEFQYAPALPIGVGPVEVDCGAAAREHKVVQPCVRVERFTHEAPPPCMSCTSAAVTSSKSVMVRHCVRTRQSRRTVSRKPRIAAA